MAEPRRRLIDRLLVDGQRASSIGELLGRYAAALDEGGMSVARLTVQNPSLHPEVAVRMHVWRPAARPFELHEPSVILDEGQQQSPYGSVEAIDLAYDAYKTRAFQRSPIHRILIEGADEVVCAIDPAASSQEFPILADLAATGATAYAAFAMEGSGGRSAFSIATCKPGGLAPGDLAALRSCVPILSLCLERHAWRHVAEILLATYVGRHAGERVLRGRIRRGDVEQMNAAIWFSDLRGFTAHSEKVGGATMIGWLNEYYDAIAAPIEQHGGEILKFIGDAALAVFPCDVDGPARACRRALDAANAANTALDALNARRALQQQPPLEHGIGLHVGDVMYGNIGARRRLDFTVIGPAVNMASRIEGLSGRLGRRLVVSRAVRDLVPAQFECLGAFALKGLVEPQDVFGLRAPADNTDGSAPGSST